VSSLSFIFSFFSFFFFISSFSKLFPLSQAASVATLSLFHQEVMKESNNSQMLLQSCVRKRCPGQ
jgi:hypothetical protein